MQPPTEYQVDPNTFMQIKDMARRRSDARRGQVRDPSSAPPMPPEVSFQLTFQCNLRCRDCFQWGDSGFYHRFSRQKQCTQLDLGVIERVLHETREARSRINLWGGEPLLYPHWAEMAALLEKESRPTVLCTNGLLIGEKIESIVRLSSNLVTVISMDGFRNSNDANRGMFIFDRTMANLQGLLSLQQQGLYQGRILVNCVITDELVPTIYDFTDFCERIGVDRLVLSLPWYITEKTAERMDNYFQANLAWLSRAATREGASWHHFRYRLDPALLPVLRAQLDQLRARVWKIRVRLHPVPDGVGIEDIVLGRERSRCRQPCCLAMTSRMAILANGDVSACPTFPEFTVGNVYERGVRELWTSERYARVRQIVNTRHLPVSLCSKCYLSAGNEL